MKKILSIALCAAAVSAFGDEVSLGTVGVTAITTSLSNAIVAVSYDDLALADNSGIVVSNFVKTTNLDAGDQLAVFNGTGTYDTWVLRQNGEVKYWDKNKVTFTVSSDGKLQKGTGTSASDITQAVGTGIWLVRQNPTEGNVAKPFYIYGKPVSSPTSTTTGGKWTLIGNPTQAEIDLRDVTVEGVATGDQIVAIGADGNPKYYDYKATTKGWQRNNGGTPESLPKIGAGLGVWIRTASNATIHWVASQE